ncbi:MAG: EAL domain-containing protein [Polyangiaceae bacterium]
MELRRSRVLVVGAGATCSEPIAGAVADVSADRLFAPPAAALSLVAEQHFDVLLVDPSTSTIDALGLLEELRRLRADATLPTIVLTGAHDSSQRRRLLAAGAVDVLAQPTDPLELTCKLRTFAGVSRLRAERASSEGEHEPELSDRLARSQKMEAFGALAGGIAHDFNNILAVILSFAGFASEGLSPRERRYADLSEVIKAANRAARLTRQLLSVTSQQPTRSETTDLNLQLADLGRAIRRAAGPDVKVTIELAPQAVVVEIDPTQFDQVVLTLVVNAREAMPHGGTVELRLELESAADDASAGVARLLVVDAGKGMDESTQRRVFEPFFTTKSKGNGAGLGLAACLSIIEAAHGRIDVKSVLGRGSTFTVELPLSDAPLTRRQAEAPLELVANGETVLLVEDEPTLLRALVRVFEAAGYRVRSAQNGADAEQLIDELGATLDAVVSDVVMPEVGGYEVAAHAARVAPNAVIFLTSGYLDGAKGDERFPVLWKPIPPRDIARTVIRALATRSEPRASARVATTRAAELALIVEGDRSAQQALTRLLKSAGYTTCVAASLDDARRLLEGPPQPDLALCDLSLPDGSGSDLLELLQGARPGVHGRVFVHTGNVSHASEQLRLVGAAFPIISKLTPPDELLSILSSTRAQSAPPSQPQRLFAPEQRNAKAPELPRERVLVVGSDEAFARATARTVESMQLEPVLARTAEEARNAAARNRFEAAIVEFVLADQGGLPLVEELRKTQPDLPVVLLTSTHVPQSQSVTLRGETTDCLLKPFSPEALRGALRRVVEAARAGRIRRQLLASHHGGDDFLSDVPAATRMFEEALSAIDLSYQPIVRTADESVFGYEALLRCAHPMFSSPSRLLAAAQVLGRVHELGARVRACVKATLLQHPARNDVIFINVDPSELGEDLPIAPTDPLLPSAHRIVLEISERAAVLSPGVALEQRLARLREHGYRLALDDLGEGYAGLASLVALRPDIAKIDMSLVRGIQQSPLKRDIVASILRMARSEKILVAAEGVENAEERRVLAELGCDLLQGYFFARPGPAFQVPLGSLPRNGDGR